MISHKYLVATLAVTAFMACTGCSGEKDDEDKINPGLALRQKLTEEAATGIEPDRKKTVPVDTTDAADPGDTTDVNESDPGSSDDAPEETESASKPVPKGSDAGNQKETEAKDGEESAAKNGAVESRHKALLAGLTIFVLAIFVGFEVITKVPPTLHTPLMSGSNAISGITLVGAVTVTGMGTAISLAAFTGFIAIVLATINVVGGFLVTHRMLSMFKKR